MSADKSAPPIKTGARHRNATTTVEMRRFIQESPLPVAELARLLNITPATVRKWKNRATVADSSNLPHHLNTTLTPVQEYVVVGLRYQLKLTLDKLLEVTQQHINPGVSRSGLARCLKRHGVSRLGDITPVDALPDKHFALLPVFRDSGTENYALNSHTLAQTLALPAEDEHTVVQVEAMHVPIEQDGSYSVLIGMATAHDWVYVDIYPDTEADAEFKAADRYMSHVLNQGPFQLKKLLARNYQTFLARFPDVRGAKTRKKTPERPAPTGVAQ
ncbi:MULTISPECIES: transcriptional regulator [Shewanella]|uniref:transcriptional regulator n=1 Tax=Shewanella TaxID=22 RepID=UPI001C661E0A|nr:MULTISPECIES: transcriptional regulator [Shewanella]QYJ76464.1 transcriptional regulator [Shewanella sp. FJAT-52076]QYK06386.1 transcriptional regulator [Shewanella zhangzhouensis]